MKDIKNFLVGIILAIGFGHGVANAAPSDHHIASVCGWEGNTATHIRANRLVGVSKIDLRSRMDMEIESSIPSAAVRKDMQARVHRLIDVVYRDDYVMDLNPSDFEAGFYNKCRLSF